MESTVWKASCWPAAVWRCYSLCLSTVLKKNVADHSLCLYRAMAESLRSPTDLSVKQINKVLIIQPCIPDSSPQLNLRQASILSSHSLLSWTWWEAREEGCSVHAVQLLRPGSTSLCRPWSWVGCVGFLCVTSLPLAPWWWGWLCSGCLETGEVENYWGVPTPCSFLTGPVSLRQELSPDLPQHSWCLGLV
jgi:hypothetical protein